MRKTELSFEVRGRGADSEPKDSELFILCLSIVR